MQTSCVIVSRFTGLQTMRGSQRRWPCVYSSSTRVRSWLCCVEVSLYGWRHTTLNAHNPAPSSSDRNNDRNTTTSEHCAVRGVGQYTTSTAHPVSLVGRLSVSLPVGCVLHKSPGDDLRSARRTHHINFFSLALVMYSMCMWRS